MSHLGETELDIWLWLWDKLSVFVFAVCQVSWVYVCVHVQRRQRRCMIVLLYLAGFFFARSFNNLLGVWLLICMSPWDETGGLRLLNTHCDKDERRVGRQRQRKNNATHSIFLLLLRNCVQLWTIILPGEISISCPSLILPFCMTYGLWLLIAWLYVISWDCQLYFYSYFQSMYCFLLILYPYWQFFFPCLTSDWLFLCFRGKCIANQTLSYTQNVLVKHMQT